MDILDVIIRPVNTEKSANIQALNKYAFIVDKRANKYEIRKAIEKIYDVKVIDINTVRYGGKRHERYTKRGLVQGKSNSYKKAYVTLAEGDKIDIFNN